MHSISGHQALRNPNHHAQVSDSIPPTMITMGLKMATEPRRTMQLAVLAARLPAAQVLLALRMTKASHHPAAMATKTPTPLACCDRAVRLLSDLQLSSGIRFS